MGCDGCSGSKRVTGKHKVRYIPQQISGDGAFIRFTPAELDWILEAFRGAHRPRGGLNESIFNKVKAGGLKDVGTFAEAGSLWNWLVMSLDGIIDIAEMFGSMSVPNSPITEITGLANRLHSLAMSLETAGLQRPSGIAQSTEDADGKIDKEASSEN